MRTLAAAVLVLLSTQIANAGERSDVWAQLARLDSATSLTAYRYWTCTEAAAKEVANRDKVTPSSLMTGWAAKEAAGQCASRGRAMIAAAGWSRAAMVKAAVRRANVEVARQVRHGEPGWVCAVEGQGCPVTR